MLVFILLLLFSLLPALCFVCPFISCLNSYIFYYLFWFAFKLATIRIFLCEQVEFINEKNTVIDSWTNNSLCVCVYVVATVEKGRIWNELTRKPVAWHGNMACTYLRKGKKLKVENKWLCKDININFEKVGGKNVSINFHSVFVFNKNGNCYSYFMCQQRQMFKTI